MIPAFDSPEEDYALTMGVEMAQGYHELGMLEDAWQELDQMESKFPGARPIAETRIGFFRDEKRWIEAIQKCEEYCAAWQNKPFGYINKAFCLHEEGNTAEAKTTLEAGPRSLESDARYHYNMGCYLAVLGEPKEARRFLFRAFSIEKGLKEFARQDEDLKSLWNTI